MSKINGEKSLANISRKRRTAQRVKDRALRASLGLKAAAPAKPAAKPAKS